MNKPLKAVAITAATILTGLYGVSARGFNIKFNSIHKTAVAKAPVAAPAISYSSAAQVYRVGAVIPSLTPANTGGAIPNTLCYQRNFFVGGGAGYDDGTGAAATFTAPQGYAYDAAGNIFVTDNAVVRKISPAGVATTFAGNKSAAGNTDGTGKNALFTNLSDVTIDAAGNLFVVDKGNYCIRKITSAGLVTHFAGSGKAGTANGTGAAASFASPQHIAIDPAGNLYVVDNGTTLRKVTPAGVVTTVATGYTSIYDIAADKAGYLYLLAAHDAPNNAMVAVKMLPTGAKTYAVPIAGARGITVNAAGTVFIGGMDESYTAKLFQLSTTGAVRMVASDFGLYSDIGSDLAGNVMIDDLSGRIYKMPSFGYAVSPALPPGLSINANGVISGRPTITYPATAFTVTAYNAAGSSSFTINITVKGAIDAPAITLPANARFTAGTAITAITPVNSGGAVTSGYFGNVTTFAGNFTAGSQDGTGTGAEIAYPMGLTCDFAGNVYVAESGGGRIRKITPAGVVTTVAPTGAYFNEPKGVVLDGYGNLFVADAGNNLIQKITPDGTVSPFAGNKYRIGGPDGKGGAATFQGPNGIGIDYLQTMYVSELGHIRKVTPEAMVTTFAGTGSPGHTDNNTPATNVRGPGSAISDDAGNLYLADEGYNVIKKISKTGVISMFAGSGNSGSDDGKLAVATFNSPYAVARDNSGNMYVADFGNNEVRMITAAGVVSTLAGITTAGKVNGIGRAAMFSQPSGLALDGKGHLYVSDYSNHAIRKIDLNGYTISPALPAGLSLNPTTGAITGKPLAAHNNLTYTITAHNGGGMSSATISLIIDAPPIPLIPALHYNDAACVVNSATTILANNTGDGMPSPAQVVATSYAGTGSTGAANGAANQASFRLLSGAICFDPAGNLLVADAGNNLIRKITPAGIVTTLAGSSGQGSANGTGTAATFKGINGMVADKSGNLFVCDALNNKIRKITPAGVVTTFAGSGTAASVNGTGTAASFTSLKCIGIDKNDVLYVNDNGNIMAISPAAVVTNKTYGNFLPTVTGIAPDQNGNIYLALSDNYIKKIDAANQVTTFAGHGTAGADDGTGTNASFNSPKGIIADAATGNIFLADAGSNKIRMITPAAVVTTYAGNGAAPLVNGPPDAAGFSNPISIAFDKFHNMYIVDAGHAVIRKIGSTGYRIAPALPTGLSLNVTTGDISGTPTVVSAKTDYLVTAYNGGGTATGALSISVVPATTQKQASFALQADSSLNANVPQPVVSAGLSPNGDGLNDVLVISNISGYPDNTLTIMGRSGNMVARISNYDNENHAFDGRAPHGGLQPKGTYFYELEYTDGASVKRKTGFIVLKY